MKEIRDRNIKATAGADHWRRKWNKEVREQERRPVIGFLGWKIVLEDGGGGHGTQDHALILSDVPVSVETAREYPRSVQCGSPLPRASTSALPSATSIAAMNCA